MGWDRKSVARTTPRPPSAYLDELYYDTAVFDPDQLRALVDVVGSHRVVLGTDHPFDLAERDPVGFVRSAGLGADAQADVLWRTAATLLGIKPATMRGDG